jgi:hypothetical protein
MWNFSGLLATISKEEKMTWHLLRTILCCLLLLIISGCVTFQGGNKIIETKLDEKFRDDFKGYQLEAGTIKHTGVNRTFPQVSYDEAWDATLVVLMQSGIIVKADKNSGVVLCITTPPTAFYVEKDEKPKVYVKVVEDLFEYDSYQKMKSVINPVVAITGKAELSDVTDKVQERGNAYQVSAEERDKVTHNLLDKVATQLYASKKWKYLTGS